MYVQVEWWDRGVICMWLILHSRNTAIDNREGPKAADKVLIKWIALTTWWHTEQNSDKNEPWLRIIIKWWFFVMLCYVPAFRRYLVTLLDDKLQCDDPSFSSIYIILPVKRLTKHGDVINEAM